MLFLKLQVWSLTSKLSFRQTWAEFYLLVGYLEKRVSRRNGVWNYRIPPPPPPPLHFILSPSPHKEPPLEIKTWSHLKPLKEGTSEGDPLNNRYLFCYHIYFFSGKMDRSASRRKKTWSHGVNIFPLLVWSKVASLKFRPSRRDSPIKSRQQIKRDQKLPILRVKTILLREKSKGTFRTYLRGFFASRNARPAEREKFRLERGEKLGKYSASERRR